MTGIFPVLPGLSWSTFKAPQWNTRIQKAVSGRELRVAFQPVPTWLFTLKYDYLPPADLATLMGFFLAQQGSLQTFYFQDPTDFNVVGGVIGVGDGINTFFQFGRTMGTFFEPVTVIAVTQMYGNGSPLDFSYWAPGLNLNAGTENFPFPPAAGNVITADFQFAFRCRFADDTYSFENFMFNLWSLKEIKLQSVLL